MISDSAVAPAVPSPGASTLVAFVEVEAAGVERLVGGGVVNADSLGFGTGTFLKGDA